MDYKVFESSEGNVWKYVFTKPDMVAEAVLYKYNNFYDRTVICCSVMSGCPVGCKFCGTGNKFVRNLTSEEIVEQIRIVLQDKNLYNDINSRCKKLQFMFMSMGEPMLNWNEVAKAIRCTHRESTAFLRTSAIVLRMDTSLVEGRCAFNTFAPCDRNWNRNIICAI